MRTSVKLAFAALIAGTLSTVAIAGGHGGKDPNVMARKAHMGLYNYNLGILGQMARGNVEYDADAASAAAANIAALTRLSQRSYWAPGTDSDTLDYSNALPVLWESFPDVIEKAQAVQAAADALAESAGTGLDGIRANIGPLGQACTACHEAYQKPQS